MKIRQYYDVQFDNIIAPKLKLCLNLAPPTSGEQSLSLPHNSVVNDITKPGPNHEADPHFSHTFLGETAEMTNDPVPTRNPLRSRL